MVPNLSVVAKPVPPASLPDADYLMDDVTSITRLSAKTVRREVKLGRLRARKCGQRWHFRPDDVRLYLAGNGR
jgi:hypothetical protein